MYYIDEVRKFRDNNTIEWQLSGPVLARQALVGEILEGNIKKYWDAVKIEKEFGLDHEDWTRFGAEFEEEGALDENN